MQKYKSFQYQKSAFTPLRAQVARREHEWQKMVLRRLHFIANALFAKRLQTPLPVFLRAVANLYGEARAMMQATQAERALRSGPLGTTVVHGDGFYWATLCAESAAGTTVGHDAETFRLAL